MACSKPRRSAMEDEKNCKLTYFFRDLLKNRIDFQISSDETKDIFLAIDTLVKEIVHRVAANVEWLGPYDRLRILKVGSMAERTSIIFPDEFDYLVVTHQDGVEVERVCKWREGYAHVKVTGRRLHSRWRPFLRGDYLQGSFSHDFTGKLTGVVEYAGSVVRKWLRRDPLQETQAQSIFDPYYDSLENAFMSEVEKVIKSPTGDMVCRRDTGTLRVSKRVENHGPAFMPTFIWEPKQDRKDVTITVDMTLAIEVNMPQHRNIIEKNDTFHSRIWERLVQHGKYMLIPCNESTSCVAGFCFRLTFTETEVDLVRGMSRHHKECYRLLKYIFNSGGGYSYLPSYVFKMLVIKHDCFCRETANLSTCFKTLVASLLHHISNVKREEKIEPSRLLRMFMPGQKFTIKIPSIFIKRHNILDGKDFKFPCEQFLSSIERMLESIATISTQDHPDDKDLKIVNNHGTAALAYASLMVPFMRKHLEYCQNCLDDYFRQYGGWASGSHR